MSIGLYIHIPFCTKKCPYCDFYSVSFDESLACDYTSAVIKRIESYKDKNLSVDTIYFGGGTPNLIGSEKIRDILCAVNKAFSVCKDAEITMEANAESLVKSDISAFAKAGINRLSLGLQSANEKELSFINRAHSPENVALCIKRAKEAGINNISLDLMLGLEGQDKESLKKSIKFCAELDVCHISSYMLKIEKNTPFYKRRSLLSLPDEDEACDLYLFACDELKKCGYEQYEISNFTKNGAVSRHNLKYWNCEEYIGIGASAHGYENGERYFYKRSIADFIKSPLFPTFDCMGGSFEEYFMLKLRLCEGLSLVDFTRKFNVNFSNAFYSKIELYQKANLVKLTENNLSFTPKGFLVSNTIIANLLEEIYA